MAKTLDKPIVIVIGGTVVPKERPTVEGSNARYSPAYTQWQKSARQALQATIAALPATMTRFFPLSGVRVEFEFHGSLRGNADLDNSEGSWLDAMVKCGILAGDNVRKVNQIGSKFFDNDRPVSAIIIYPNWTPVSVIDPSLLKAPSVPTTVKVAKEVAARRSRKTPVKTAAAKKPRLTIVKDPKK
jgi:hypothetical protein